MLLSCVGPLLLLAPRLLVRPVAPPPAPAPPPSPVQVWHSIRLAVWGSPTDIVNFQTFTATLQSSPALAYIGASLQSAPTYTSFSSYPGTVAPDSLTSGPLSAYISQTVGFSTTALANYAGVALGSDLQPTWGPPGTAGILTTGLLNTAGPQNKPGLTTAPPNPPAPSGGVNVAGAVGGAVGGTLGLAAVIGLAAYLSRGMRNAGGGSLP